MSFHAHRMVCRVIPAVVLAASMAVPALAVNVLSATVRPSGPRTGSSGDNFFNVEGSANGTNASYGVLRFDVSGVKSGLDAALGAGTYSLSDITLQLTESNAAFTLPGGLEFAFTPDNTTDIKTSSSPLKFPTPTLAGQEVIANGTFNTTGNTGTGTMDSYGLLNATQGSLDLQNQVLTSGLATLVINPTDPNVAATWRGQNPSTTLAAPALLIKATNRAGLSQTITVTTSAIPEPSTVALLLMSAPAVLGAKRLRRK